MLESEDVAVEEWLLSNKVFHSMRDHPQHGDWQILTGLPSLLRRSGFKYQKKEDREKVSIFYIGLLCYYYYFVILSWSWFISLFKAILSDSEKKRTEKEVIDNIKIKF